MIAEWYEETGQNFFMCYKCFRIKEDCVENKSNVNIINNIYFKTEMIKEKRFPNILLLKQLRYIFNKKKKKK